MLEGWKKIVYQRTELRIYEERLIKGELIGEINAVRIG
jgi:hypothetical protein